MSRFLYLLFFSFILNSCSKEIYKSSWQSEKFSVNKNEPVLPIPLKYYDEKSKLQFDFSNDDKNLYLCIRASEQESQMSILHNGIQIWLDTIGKKKHQSGVFFPVRNRNRFSKNDSNTLNHKYTKSIIQKKNLSDLNEIQLTGFKNAINGIVPLPNIYGIAANIELDSSKLMICKIIIPFETFYKKSLNLKDTLKRMSLSIAINGGDRSNERHKGQGEGERDGRGMQGGGFGGSSGGFGGGNMGMRGGGFGGGMHSGRMQSGQQGNRSSGNSSQSVNIDVIFHPAFKKK